MTPASTAHGLPVEDQPGEIDPSLAEILLAGQPAELDEQDWERLLQSVKAGGRAVIGSLQPEDQTAIHALGRYGLNIQLHAGIGSWMGCYHWMPDSALFAGLPSGGLALAPYTECLPKYIMTELGGEVLAGSLRNTSGRIETPLMVWFSDVEAVHLGEGILFLCQYRAFAAPGDGEEPDPVASRLGYNLLQLAARWK